MEDWMEQIGPEETVMAQMQAQAKELTRLEFEMMAAEDAFNRAKAAFTEYATKTLPELYLRNGIDSLTTSEGKTIRIVTKTRASIKKGADNGKTSQQQIGAWLRKHGGEALIKSKINVDSQAVPRLQEAGVPYEEVIDINTNALKSFIVGALGQSGSPATITADDLPEGLSFYQWQQAEIS